MSEGKFEGFDDKLKDLKVIIASSLGQEDDLKKAKDIGADEYFIKAEISIYDLIANVKRILGD